MRRGEKEIKGRSEIDAVIRACQVCRMAMVDNGDPYVVPMCFGYDGESLYFHCAREGRKVDVLRANSRVCFEFDEFAGLDRAPEACRWGIRYRSVIGTGRAEIVDDADEKRRALTAIMAQYAPGTFEFSDAAVARTVAIRVRIETVTGKQALR